jgi:hypothetical protein
VADSEYLARTDVRVTAATRRRLERFAHRSLAGTTEVDLVAESMQAPVCTRDRALPARLAAFEASGALLGSLTAPGHDLRPEAVSPGRWSAATST